MKKLLRGLIKDEQDEIQAIKNYGKRKKQATKPEDRVMLRHIQTEEKEHRKMLGGTIRKKMR